MKWELHSPKCFMSTRNPVQEHRFPLSLKMFKAHSTVNFDLSRFVIGNVGEEQIQFGKIAEWLKCIVVIKFRIRPVFRHCRSLSGMLWTFEPPRSQKSTSLSVRSQKSDSTCSRRRLRRLRSHLLQPKITCSTTCRRVDTNLFLNPTLLSSNWCVELSS